ncbi:MAG: dodecin family protein [Negativicutes bacterium]|nr:dodecin family protein [Negativicutes bacterium]
MGVVKVIELVGTSHHNWTDAVDNAVMEASKTIDEILGVEVTNFTANIDEGRISEYKADVKVAFQVRT